MISLYSVKCKVYNVPRLNTYPSGNECLFESEVSFRVPHEISFQSPVLPHSFFCLVFPCFAFPLPCLHNFSGHPMDSTGSSWTGRKGYVQEAIKEDGIRLPRNSGVLVCGHAQMGEEVKALALSAGVLDGRVLSNF